VLSGEVPSPDAGGAPSILAQSYLGHKSDTFIRCSSQTSSRKTAPVLDGVDLGKMSTCDAS
jgi:hypothetical protein